MAIRMLVSESTWQEADIVKISQEKLEFLTGSTDLATARQLWHHRLLLLVVTRDTARYAYLKPQNDGEVPGYTISVIDTTDARDGFVAGLLVGLLEQNFDCSKYSIERTLRLANAVGALVCSRRG